MKRALPVLVLLLAGCAAPPTAPVALYDFGLPASPVVSQRLPGSLAIARVTAPEWLDTPALYYRLDYHDGARLQGYAHSRWVAPPAQLLTERLFHAALDAAAAVREAEGVRADYVLRVELEEFSQVFATPQESRGVVQARATLVSRGGRSLLAKKAFLVERPAPSADAEGGVRALTAASDALVGEVLDWSAEALRAAGAR